ncbi:MAG TPA: hypothetical protein VJ943_06710 [Desulfotignum sp.]|nr:hypothetical protein [Desulfotignum sp.]
MKADLLKKMQSVEPAIRDVLILMMEEFNHQSNQAPVTRTDFEELKGIVKDLAVAQNRTEQRLESLTLRVEELAQAQNRTEQRLESLTIRVDELAEAQNRTEKRLEELAQAQNRTEKGLESLTARVDELAQAQNRTEQRLESLTARVDELAQAQSRTELIVQKLSENAVDIRKQMGGLAMAVGYGIEDKLMPHIPEFVDTAFGIRADIVDRRNIVYPDGSYDEANIYVEGEKNGNRIYLIGECKAQPGKRDFDKFAGLLGRIRENREGNVSGMMIGYHYAPDVENYAKENYPAIKFYRTFEVERGGQGI